MPEGPEVAFAARKLSELLVGAEYVQLQMVSGSYKTKKDALHDSFRTGATRLNRISAKSGTKLQFSRVGSKGKYLYFELQSLIQDIASGNWQSKGYIYIGTHFMMTGRWLIEPAEHTRVKLVWQKPNSNNGKNHTLYYDDTRDFGQLAILSRSSLEQILSDLGPDILAKSTSFKVFRDALEPAARSMIASAIKDQKYISGIGNYMRADILYLAKIAPKRKIASLNDDEWRELYSASRKVARDSLAANGTAAYNPSSGHYKPIVYGASKDPQGRPVSKMSIGGQTLYWVPAVQK